jgi:peptidyl-prolyl cis-trans isomerase SurA
MKSGSIVRVSLSLLTILIVGGALGFPAHAQNEQVVDEIVAVVGDRIVLKSEVDGFAFNIVQQQQIPYSDALWLEALQQLIDQEVVTIYAKRDTTLIVEDQQVEQALDQRIAQLTQQVGSQARLEEMYGKSIVQIKDELREQYRDQLLGQQFQQNKLREVNITPSEVNAWFSRFPTDSLPTLPDLVRIAHIVRYPDISPEARASTMEIITAIRDSIVAGRGTLENYAQRFSEDPGSAANGGRGSFPLSQLAPEFAAVAARIPIGEISQPFETEFGLHILRVNERLGENVDFNHILVTFDESTSDPSEAIEYLTMVRDSLLQANMPFELMAKRHSEEERSAVQGGRVVDPSTGNRDLPLPALGPTWQQTIAGMEVGDISEPVEVELLDGRRAYHILMLQRFTPSHTVDIITDYERIHDIALQEKQQQVLSEWIGELREDVYIVLSGRAQELSMATAG